MLSGLSQFNARVKYSGFDVKALVIVIPVLWSCSLKQVLNLVLCGAMLVWSYMGGGDVFEKWKMGKMKTIYLLAGHGSQWAVAPRGILNNSQ